MRRLLLLVVVLVLALPVPGQAADMWRESGRACVFGGAVMGVSSALVLYPAIAAGATTLPAGSLILGNTIFGCGVAALGAAAAWGFAWFYDQMFGQPDLTPRLPPGPSTLYRMRESTI
ncbi:membrane hypothetical protein [Azospirillaceae bacterium]